MHRHVEALTILLFKQQSVDKALEYCAEVVKKEEAEDQQVYLHLLHLHVRLFLVINRLLHPPESTPAELKEKYFAASFQILDRYHAHLVPEQVLDEYPDYLDQPDQFLLELTYQPAGFAASLQPHSDTAPRTERQRSE